MAKRAVFYSWLSGRPNNTNRGFIESALDRAAKAIAADESLQLEPVIEQGASGLGGTRDIAATILERIDNCDAFVCDLSFIGGIETPGEDGEDPSKRHLPNPNVLLELGYAIKTKTWSRIVIVFNNAFGRVEDLPFDVRGKTILQYTAAGGDEDRASERKRLAAGLEFQFRQILVEERPTPDPIEHVVKLIDDKQYGALQSFVKKQADPVIAALTANRFDVNVRGDEAEFMVRLHDYDKICLPLIKLLGAGASADSQPDVWIDLVDRMGNAYESFIPDGFDWWREMRAYPGILAFSAAGVIYVAAKRYDMLARLLKETSYHEYSPTRSYENARNRISLARYLYMKQFNQQERWGAILKIDKRTGMSDRVASTLVKTLSDFIPQANKFDFAFDKFEYLTCLHLFATGSEETGPRAPYGAFLRKRRFQAGMGKELVKEVGEGGGINSPIIKARIAGNDNQDFNRFVAEYDAWLQANTKSMMFLG